MARKYVFADECGNFDFSSGKGASKYFILVSVTMAECTIGHELLGLRRELAHRGIGLDRDQFHATTDSQAVRDQVFKVIAPADLRIDSVILEKRKTVDHLRSSETRFYKTAWYQHMKYVAPKIASAGDELLVVGASMGTGKKRQLFHDAVTDVFKQVSPTTSTRVACWSDVSDPCLQVADYCAWSIQRKWEMSDTRSYDIIRGKIRTEFAVFGVGTKYYY